MTEKRKEELKKETLARGYTQYNFVCVNGNNDPGKQVSKIVPREWVKDHNQESIHWGNNWIMINHKWAEFKSIEPEIYEIY